MLIHLYSRLDDAGKPVEIDYPDYEPVELAGDRADFPTHKGGQFVAAAGFFTDRYDQHFAAGPVLVWPGMALGVRFDPRTTRLLRLAHGEA